MYWSLSVVGWILLTFIFSGELWEPFVNKMAYLPSQMIVTYGMIYLIIPQLVDRKYLRVGVWLVFLTYIVTVLARILKVYVYETAMGDKFEKNPIIEIATELFPLLAQYVIWCFMFPIITITILAVIQHLRQKAQIAALLKEKNQAELNVLKAQVHPHFLFNTLNNLYTLALQKSPQTAEIAGRLHDILDYMFNKYENLYVRLDDEIALIRNYVELERIRYGDRLRLEMDFEVDNHNFQLAPLLLLSLVENAFKHGASKDMKEPWIKISMLVKSDQLKFEVWNTKPKNGNKRALDINSGIGLINIQK
jgi:two-component system LytT family sensor kinase